MYTEQMKVAKNEVKTCLNIWKDILTEQFSDKIDVIYSKGSACKSWDSEIDYVPIISDVDIHIRFINSNQDDPLSLLSLNDALKLSEKYEKIFQSKINTSLHLPRVQIVNVNKILKNTSFVFPRVEDIVLLYGWYDAPELVSDEIIRDFDKEEILSGVSDYLNTLPEKAFDRAGLDYWVLLRSMNWRVSPTPVRLLTQLLSNKPYDIWSWNRSKIVRELIDQNLTSLATSYQNFYRSGWKLFLSNFSEMNYYRELITHGHSVLFKTLSILKNS